MAGTVVAEQDKTNLAAVVIEIAQFERMQARRQRSLVRSFRAEDVLRRYQPPPCRRYAGWRRRRKRAQRCRSPVAGMSIYPRKIIPTARAAGSRTRETDRIDDTTAAGSVKSLRNADRVATGKTAEVPIDAQTGFSVPRLQRPRIILLLIANGYPVARTAVGMVGPDVQRTIVADKQRGRRNAASLRSAPSRQVYSAKRHRAADRRRQSGPNR